MIGLVFHVLAEGFVLLILLWALWLCYALHAERRRDRRKARAEREAREAVEHADWLAKLRDFGEHADQACALTEPSGPVILPTDSPAVVRFLTTPYTPAAGEDYRR